MQRLPTWTVPWVDLAGRLGRAIPGRWTWDAFGPDGICGSSLRHTCIVSAAAHDGVEWIHASIAREDHLPSYFDLVALHKAIWGADGFAYQVFASDERHVSIHDKALHLWGRTDGERVLPDFGAEGSI